MRYKSKVLAQHPDARLAVIDRYDDGAPRCSRVIAGPDGQLILDCRGEEVQGATAAWRSAYYFLVRQRRAEAAVMDRLDRIVEAFTGEARS